MKPTFDLNVKELKPLISPEALKKELPITEEISDTVIASRKTVEKILLGEDRRLLAVVGPCSIHDEKAVVDYAEKLNQLKEKVKETLCVIMRVYFEKPRTTVGWKGLINDPFIDSSYNIEEGLRKARKILLHINGLGLPAATEMLDPITPQYIAGLISWVAIGARTTESQTHREMASGLSMPIGFKNSTDGSLSAALNALEAARAPQSFLGIDSKGYTSIVQTTGNPWGHIVLRGGGGHPNYDPVSLEKTQKNLEKRGLPTGIMIDCSHENSGKKYSAQPFVWNSVLQQRLEGNDSIIGMMLESNLNEGNQKYSDDPSCLKYGVSITDECISWETTKELLLYADEKLGSAR